MDIQTKYNIDDHLFHPRSYSQYYSEEKEFEGHVWKRSWHTFEPTVKEKKIVDIKVEIRHGKQEVKYRMIDVVGKDPLFGNWYDEEQLDRCFTTHDEAMHLAEEYAIHLKKEYYG